MNWHDGRKLGPNVLRLVTHKMALIAIPVGCEDPLGAGLKALIGGDLGKNCKEAMAWVAEALAAVKAAPDNPYGDDDEAIAGTILLGIKEREKSMRSKQ